MEKVRGWNFGSQLYQESGSIITVPNVFAIQFTNLGDDIARLTNLIIFPSLTPATAAGDSRVISGHDLDLFKGSLYLAFAGVGVAPLVEVTQFFYLPGDFKITEV
jgi:hypothetical protein